MEFGSWVKCNDYLFFIFGCKCLFFFFFYCIEEVIFGYDFEQSFEESFVVGLVINLMLIYVEFVGILILLVSDGFYFVVVLISGVGFNDCDVMFFGYKQFGVLVDYLICEGIVVLCYDDCGCYVFGGNFVMVMSVDFVDDVVVVLCYFVI